MVFGWKKRYWMKAAGGSTSEVPSLPVPWMAPAPTSSCLYGKPRSISVDIVAVHIGDGKARLRVGLDVGLGARQRRRADVAAVDFWRDLVGAQRGQPVAGRLRRGGRSSGHRGDQRQQFYGLVETIVHLVS